MESRLREEGSDKSGLLGYTRNLQDFKAFSYLKIFLAESIY